MWISRFNPHDMEDSEVKALATGRDLVLQQIINVIKENQASSGALQHVLLTAPRGMGKSFALRMVQVALKEIVGSPLFVLMPEEQPNVSSAPGLLDEIRRLLEGGAPVDGIAKWKDPEKSEWEAAVRNLNSAIVREATKKQRPPILVAAIENFDVLLNAAFSTLADQSRLRKFLSEQCRVMIIATTLRGDFDLEYERRLFHSFVHKRLQPWQEQDYIAYFRRRREREGRGDVNLADAKLRAISTFTGGSPRMAVVLADILEKDDPLSAAETLNRLVDELTPYYQDVLNRCPHKSKILLDALIRGGEPCSQSELAARLGTSQNRIAQQFSWLREHEIVFGERRTGGRDILYRVADRVFVQYYRKRYVLHGSEYSSLSAMTDLLETFFTADQNRAKALSLFTSGLKSDAFVFMRVALEQSEPKIDGQSGLWATGAFLEGSLLADAGRYPEAVSILKRSIREAESTASLVNSALIQREICLILEKAGQYHEALDARSR